MQHAWTSMQHNIIDRQGWSDRGRRVTRLVFWTCNIRVAVKHLLYCLASLKSTLFIVLTMKVAIHKEP